MKNIMIFSGTTEGRTLSLLLSENKINHIVSVATDYGEKLGETSSFAVIKKGRMDEADMEVFFDEKKLDVVIDATHPYAKEVTENIKEASKKTGVKYMRYVRNTDYENKQIEKIRYFKSVEECVFALSKSKGNILLTTGSKELSAFCEDEKIKERIIARVLPGIESIKLCEENGLSGKQIIAMQGPFSYEMNMSMIKQFDIKYMVTKQSGRIGGFDEKYLAAKDAGIELLVIGLSENEKGNSLKEICDELGIKDINPSKKESIMNIALIGCGMGSKRFLTNAASEFIDEADIILGAERLIEPYMARVEKKPYYLADDIIPYLESKQQDSGNMLKVAVLFSGDTGFYSGADKLSKALNKACDDGSINADIKIIPGISSVSYLASKLGESWNNSRIMSIHGRKVNENLQKEIKEAVMTGFKSYILLSDKKQLLELLNFLKENGLLQCEIYAGYQMSYDEENIIKIDMAAYDETETEKELKDGLYTCLIKNNFVSDVDSKYDKNISSDKDKCLNIYFKDEEFKRGKVPMTKEEVRALSIAKLGLRTSSVVYDVGSGTGSIAVQMAAMSDKLKVFAIERKKEAIELIRENCRIFNVNNVTVCEGEAPDAFEELPAPTHAFIGGSGGKLNDILKRLYEKNPDMRIVINAVSTETMQLCMELENHFKIKDFSMIQLGITGLNHIGEHHLLKSENPIWICSFAFDN